MIKKVKFLKAAVKNLPATLKIVSGKTIAPNAAASGRFLLI
jgi:hypothetical protein